MQDCSELTANCLRAGLTLKYSAVLRFLTLKCVLEYLILKFWQPEVLNHLESSLALLQKPLDMINKSLESVKNPRLLCLSVCRNCFD